MLFGVCHKSSFAQKITSIPYGAIQMLLQVPGEVRFLPFVMFVGKEMVRINQESDHPRSRVRVEFSLEQNPVFGPHRRSTLQVGQLPCIPISVKTQNGLTPTQHLKGQHVECAFDLIWERPLEATDAAKGVDLRGNERAHALPPSKQKASKYASTYCVLLDVIS